MSIYTDKFNFCSCFLLIKLPVIDMQYTAVIRTLGTAGQKYQQTLDSLVNQTIPPHDILVYIAEGYPLPKETCGKEKYIYVKKGMVAQRALPYNEVKTEWMLLLDDDVYLPNSGVECLFKAINEHNVDIVSPNTFENHKMGNIERIHNALLYKAVPSKNEKWAYKVLTSGGFLYKSNPTEDFYRSESNAGPCSLWRKQDFLNIHFEDEIDWLDSAPYALPDDQVMFYKAHKIGLKIGTVFNSGIIHLDAGTSVEHNLERSMKLLYSDIRNQILFCRKYVWGNEHGIKRFLLKFPLNYSLTIRFAFALRQLLMGNNSQIKTFFKAVRDARAYTGF